MIFDLYFVATDCILLQHFHTDGNELLISVFFFYKKFVFCGQKASFLERKKIFKKKERM